MGREASELFNVKMSQRQGGFESCWERLFVEEHRSGEFMGSWKVNQLLRDEKANESCSRECFGNMERINKGKPIQEAG